jgi:hypothetical protein
MQILRVWWFLEVRALCVDWLFRHWFSNIPTDVRWGEVKDLLIFRSSKILRHGAVWTAAPSRVFWRHQTITKKGENMSTMPVLVFCVREKMVRLLLSHLQHTTLKFWYILCHGQSCSAGVHKISKNVSATSKLEAPEWWQDASPKLKIRKS